MGQGPCPPAQQQTMFIQEGRNEGIESVIFRGATYTPDENGIVTIPTVTLNDGSITSWTDLATGLSDQGDELVFVSDAEGSHLLLRSDPDLDQSLAETEMAIAHSPEGDIRYFINSPSEVPAPPSCLLVAAGLVGLAGLGRWRKDSRGQCATPPASIGRAAVDD